MTGPLSYLPMNRSTQIFRHPCQAFGFTRQFRVSQPLISKLRRSLGSQLLGQDPKSR